MTPGTNELAYAAIATALETRIGASAGRMSGQTLAGAVDRACRATRSDSAITLLGRLEAGDTAALDALVVETTVGETYFFRETEQMCAFRTHILRSALARTSGPLRIWSAGCATGEEPYSLAIECLQALGPSARERVEILATDVSAAALKRAREGVYGDWSFRGVASATRAHWFDEEGRVGLQPRELVRFETHNLHADRDWPRDVSILFCRNVLIYFPPAQSARCLERLALSLCEGGWLVLGPSDPPPSSSLLRAVQIGGTLAYRRIASDDSTELTIPIAIAPPPVTPTFIPRPASVKAVPTSPTADTRLARARELADRGMEQRALLALDQIVKDDPTAEALLIRASVKGAMGDHAGAAGDAERALSLDPSLALAHVVLASSRAASGDVSGARRAARDAQRTLGARDGSDAFVQIQRTAARIARIGSRRRRAQ